MWGKRMKFGGTYKKMQRDALLAGERVNFSQDSVGQIAPPVLGTANAGKEAGGAVISRVVFTHLFAGSNHPPIYA